MARVKQQSRQSRSPRRSGSFTTGNSSSVSTTPIDNILRSPTPPASVESSLESRFSSHQTSHQRPINHITSSPRAAPAECGSSKTSKPAETTLRPSTSPVSTGRSLERRSDSPDASQKPSKRSRTSSSPESSRDNPLARWVTKPSSNSSSPSRKRSREIDNGAAIPDAVSVSPSKRVKSSELEVHQETEIPLVHGQGSSRLEPTVLLGREITSSSPGYSRNLKQQLDIFRKGDENNQDAAESSTKAPPQPKRGNTPAKKATNRKPARGKSTPKNAAVPKAVKLCETEDDPSVDSRLDRSPQATTVSAAEGDVKPVATRTSARSRVPPKRLSENVDPKPTTKQTKSATAPAATPRKRSARNAWAPEHLLTQPNSKLVQTNLVKLLKSEAAWEALGKEERLELAALLPNKPLPVEWPDEIEVPNVMADHVDTPTFRTDLADWQNYLAAGYFQPAWLENAAKAMQRRANGDFDEWKERERDAYWADAEYKEEDENEEKKAQGKGRAKAKANVRARK